MRLDTFLLKEQLENYYTLDGNDYAKRVVMFTSKLGKDQHTNTIQNFIDILKGQKIDYYVAYTDDSYLVKDDGKLKIYNVDDKDGFEINSKDTLIINRASVAYQTSSLDIISQLEKNHFYCINNRECLEVCGDKFRTYVKLSDLNISTPKTSMVRNEESIKHAHEYVGGKFPVILKTITGTQGKGVFIAESWKNLLSVLQTVWSLNSETEIIMQEFIESDGDYRIHVLNDDVIAVMKRKAGKDEFRANYHLGGSVEGIDDISDEIKSLAIKAAKAVGAVWAGVDIIVNRKTNEAYVLEVNSSPGTEGIEKATNINVSQLVMNYAIEKKNWRITTFTCGYIENIWVNDIGYVKAKFDTGNGSVSSIHADEYKLNDKKVIWTHKGKKLEHDLIEIKKVKIGGLKTEYEERPVIKLTVVFNGETFENIPFALTNRINNSKKHKSEVLINRKFMTLAGLNIDPSGMYLLSLKEPNDKEYA